MKRDNQFDEYVICKASTAKAVVTSYMDSFEIEKVKLRFARYEDASNLIDIYIDFEDMSLIAEDAKSGRLINQVKQERVTLKIGGTRSSKKYNGQPESKILSLGMSDTGDKLFLNASSGIGKLSDTGAIIPAGQPSNKISVAMTISDFRKLMIYTYDCVKAYLTQMVP